ncbi:MAG: hypothetical protein IJQ72_05495 [Bacilli bacterium]|nr:hypothetical protein [Bacilli bacterium]
MKITRDTIVKRRDYLIKRQEELGLSNFKAAELLDISVRYFARFKDGTRGKYISVHLILKICEVFRFGYKEFLLLESDFLKRS